MAVHRRIARSSASLVNRNRAGQFASAGRRNVMLQRIAAQSRTRAAAGRQAQIRTRSAEVDRVHFLFSKDQHRLVGGRKRDLGVQTILKTGVSVQRAFALKNAGAKRGGTRYKKFVGRSFQRSASHNVRGTKSSRVGSRKLGRRGWGR